MNIPVLLAIGSCCGKSSSIFAILLLLIFVALIVWLIMWLLFGCCRGKCEGDQESEESLPVNNDESKSTSESVAATKVPEEDVPAADEEAAEEEPAAEEDIEEESKFESGSEEDARNLFKAELEAGSVRQDLVYGIIYDSPPEGGADDLKKIKGVAKVLEGKLNDIGVYRFKQVAVWTDAACEEFSKLITFKDRIYKDNWIAQAKGFHEEQYDDKL